MKQEGLVLQEWGLAKLPVKSIAHQAGRESSGTQQGFNRVLSKRN